LHCTRIAPVVCVYATFLNRAFDQVLMDVAMHRMQVTIVLDRAGVIGPDGPTHHGMWDLSLLGAIPGMRVAAPRGATRLRALLHEAVAHPGPSALRFPKGAPEHELPARGGIGTADLLVQHGMGGVLLLPVGPCAATAMVAAARPRPGRRKCHRPPVGCCPSTRPWSPRPTRSGSW
jgi:1-deoxy-D-xylulose-5-phosphate synthase